MASATRLPLKPIAVSAAVVFTVIASRANLYKHLLNTVTGPGKYSRIFAITLILANLKNAPFAWHASSPPSSSQYSTNLN